MSLFRVDVLLGHFPSSSSSIIPISTSTPSTLSEYQKEYQLSLSKPGDFWLDKSKLLKWFRRPPRHGVQLVDDHDVTRWFKGGIMNASYLCADWQVEKGNGEVVALIQDCPALGIKRKMTYGELRAQVSKLAAVLKYRFDIGVGDVVVLYLPNILETVIAQLAVARLGAIHCLIYGGLAGQALLARLKDADPKLVLSCTGTVLGDPVYYKPVLDEILKQLDDPELRVLFLHRHEMPNGDARALNWVEGRDFNWADEINAETRSAPIERVDATHPLYILYESTGPGKPLGIMRDHGSLVPIVYSMNSVFNASGVFFSASPLAMATGHSYGVYGPLATGLTSVIYEGKTVDMSDGLWRVCSEYSVTVLFVVPTTLRLIHSLKKAESPEASASKLADLSSLKAVFSSTERLDTVTLAWLKTVLPSTCSIVDSWWQSETGWTAISVPLGLGSNLIVKPGSAGVPIPGFNIVIMGENGVPAPPGVHGKVCIKLPLPPGCMYSVWHGPARFAKNYLNIPGYYESGDGGYCDKDGFVFVTGRMDDVVNVAGHRVSTANLEVAIRHHPSVADVAVVAMKDHTKGDIAVGLVVLKSAYTPKSLSQTPSNTYVLNKTLKDEIIAVVRKRIGSNYAWFRHVFVVKRLPKNEDLKIMRLVVRHYTFETLLNSNFVPSVLKDTAILDEIRTSIRSNVALM